MLIIEDPRSWFAIAALAVALVLTAGSAHGTLRYGDYAGGGQLCFADVAGGAATVFSPMADERRP
jgi:hypothetical protein